ncbi:hypothetical protein ACTMU2_11890 [Cupriavidus basilensis]
MSQGAAIIPEIHAHQAEFRRAAARHPRASGTRLRGSPHQPPCGRQAGAVGLRRDGRRAEPAWSGN